MDVLRAALGESTLNYLGSSYGTKLGATYAQLFPHRVGRFVLDGAVDPTLGTLASSVQQAGGFQRALDAYAADCIASSDGCFLGKTVPEVEQKISDLLDQLAQHPLPAGDRELTAGNAFYGVAVTLYSKAYWVLLSNALRMALSGDGTGLMVLADAYAARRSDGTFENNSMEAFVDISCLDDPYAVPASQVPSHYPAFEKASPVFGKVFAWALTSCTGFRPRAEEKTPVIHAQGAAPIVVIGTTRDPATPYRWAVHLAASPRLGRAGHPQRRRPHRLPHRQRLHRRPRPRLPGLRRRTGRRHALLTPTDGDADSRPVEPSPYTSGRCPDRPPRRGRCGQHAALAQSVERFTRNE